MLNKILFSPQVNVVILWISVFVLSLVPVAVDVPATFFSNKHNFLNQWFVKWSWLWTMLVTGPYMILTAYVYGSESWKKTVMRAILRLMCATAIWYFWTKKVFPFVENITGVCTKLNNVPDFLITDKRSCRRENGTWKAFDISGHSFLLTFIILFQSSELQIHKHWHKIPSKAPIIIQLGSKALTKVKSRFNLTLNVITLLFVCNCAFMILWHFMLINTCLYFHNFFDKPLAAGLAILSWMATYNEWYKKQFSPGLPGKSVLFQLLRTSTKSIK